MGPNGAQGIPGMIGNHTKIKIMYINLLKLGLRGEKGEPGVMGVEGEIGLQGLIGERGEIGRPGIDGKIGITGQTGKYYLMNFLIDNSNF